MAGRMSIAYAFLALLFILNVVAVSFPLTGAVKAPLFLMAIYYWAVYRPRLLPPLVVFLAGCTMDLLSGLPVGMNALVFVAVQWVISGQRRFLMGQSFMMIWIGFAVVSIASVIVQWGLFGVLNLRWLPPDAFLVSGLFGIALFPLICIILHLIHKVLPVSQAGMRMRTHAQK